MRQGPQKGIFPPRRRAEDSFFVWRAKGLRRGAISIHNSIREREQPRGVSAEGRRPRPLGAERALRGLVGSGGSKVGASKGEGGNRSPRQLELKTLAKSLTTSPSAIVCGVCAGGDNTNKWWATRTASRTTTGQGHALLGHISTGYGTVTGELHPPPRQGNARLTSSTAARLNIIDRPVYTFINIHHP